MSSDPHPQLHHIENRDKGGLDLNRQMIYTAEMETMTIRERVMGYEKTEDP